MSIVDAIEESNYLKIIEIKKYKNIFIFLKI